MVKILYSREFYARYNDSESSDAVYRYSINPRETDSGSNFGAGL